MLRIDKAGNTAAFLNFSHHMKGNGRLAAGFRSIDLNDPALGNTAESKRNVKRKGSRRDRFHIHVGLGLTEFHDSAFAEFFLKVADRCLERPYFLRAFFFSTHIRCILQ